VVCTRLKQGPGSWGLGGPRSGPGEGGGGFFFIWKVSSPPCVSAGSRHAWNRVTIGEVGE